MGVIEKKLTKIFNISASPKVHLRSYSATVKLCADIRSIIKRRLLTVHQAHSSCVFKQETLKKMPTFQFARVEIQPVHAHVTTYEPLVFEQLDQENVQCGFYQSEVVREAMVSDTPRLRTCLSNKARRDIRRIMIGLKIDGKRIVESHGTLKLARFNNSINCILPSNGYRTTPKGIEAYFKSMSEIHTYYSLTSIQRTARPELQRLAAVLPDCGAKAALFTHQAVIWTLDTIAYLGPSKQARDYIQYLCRLYLNRTLPRKKRIKIPKQQMIHSRKKHAYVDAEIWDPWNMMI